MSAHLGKGTQLGCWAVAPARPGDPQLSRIQIRGRVGDAEHLDRRDSLKMGAVILAIAAVADGPADAAASKKAEHELNALTS